MGKYGNRKTEVDGIVFDSRHEASRYIQLKYMMRFGLISDLELQVPFELIPKQKDRAGNVVRPVRYQADFVYKRPNGETVVEDAKGVRTEVYKIKKKLMLERYGIEIQEV